ncbi:MULTISPECIES: ABC transporter permease subunit [Gemmobacter]|jgi:putative spermidine/putrescine transport system permease protein|uniref:ABC transporter permease n=1 Tax=Gemmobacter nanjingensis TaxID=488454 RepID=A0ABQ3FAR6_9RHOB|nr:MULTISPECIES: ABC transporter permease subunit [Gemmobacter]OJY27253.1 MAG: acriflavin resistance protein [Rhodobacterales bacterium 65-51]GHC16172.1 ABC transporter permease [Gemmobacter nanjingensis]
MSTASTAPRRRLPLTWLGLLPFVIFVTLFLILPTMYIVIGAFQDRSGGFTLQNLRDLNTGTIPSSYWISIKISVASSALGCLIGFGMAAAVVFGAVPKAIKAPLMTFSGVASNFAGVPLAFAFLATFGPVGLVTLFLRNNFGIVLQRDLGFSILSFWGLTVTYLFFQIPLMILIITPALEGLRREWKEAAEVLGATTAQYWRMVAFPILFPSLLGTFALLFANAFGAVATAIALTGSALNIVPIQLFAQIRGDVLGNPNLGYAMAFGMIVVTAIANIVYIWLRIRAERWMK